MNTQRPQVNPLPLVQWVEFTDASDPRGTLTEINFKTLPFVPVRSFFITDVPAGTKRGGHSHRKGDQLLICVSGRVEVELRSNARTETVLCEKNRGLLLRQGIWSQQTYLEENSSLLVLCSHSYDPHSYVYDI